MRLNLGCGCVQIHETDWVNVDKMSLVGVDQVVDLFRYPFPWATSSVSEIRCSHLLEHVPHEAKLSETSAWPYHTMEFVEWAEKLLDMDGFYSFMSEVWRVLEPGGLADFVVPYGMSRYAMQDPDHTRFIILATVNYLTPQAEDPGGKKTFDRDTPFVFKLAGLQCKMDDKEYETLFRLGKTGDERFDDWSQYRQMQIAEHVWGALIEMEFILQAIKSEVVADGKDWQVQHGRTL